MANDLSALPACETQIPYAPPLLTVNTIKIDNTFLMMSLNPDITMFRKVRGAYVPLHVCMFTSVEMALLVLSDFHFRMRTGPCEVEQCKPETHGLKLFGSKNRALFSALSVTCACTCICTTLQNQGCSVEAVCGHVVFAFFLRNWCF